MRYVALGVGLFAALTLIACSREPLSTELSAVPQASEEPIPLPDPGEPLEDLCPSCAGIFTGYSEDDCYLNPERWDVDADGVFDACENGHAQHFAPMFVFARDCNWDNSLGRMGGEYFYAVERKSKFSSRTERWEDVMRFAYLPAYYRDCGSADDLGIDDPHSGDSEFVIIDIYFDGGSNHWLTDAIFLSAHCPSGDCKWYVPLSFRWVDDEALGAPIVWVSQHKHANYPSRAKCNSGAVFGFDTCAANSFYVRFPAAYTQQNIGSWHHPNRDCAGPFSSSPLADAGAVECMWSWEPQVFPALPPLQRFNGWQDNIWGEPPPPYGQILQQYVGINPPR